MYKVGPIVQSAPSVSPAALGDPAFLNDYGIKYAYLAGSMYKGIASKEMVLALGRAGLMGYLGAGGMALDEIDRALSVIGSELVSGQSFGANLLCNPERPDLEDQTVELYLNHGVRFIEAAAYRQLTPSLVRCRLRGVTTNLGGEVVTARTLMAKVSRPEVAAAFLRPAPDAILRSLVESGRLSVREAELGSVIPMADDICVEADSGGHTDGGVAFALLPAIEALRDEMMSQYRYGKKVRIGAAGGIGTPQAAAAAFMMGADFILTGSINQCTVEAGTSSEVKDILQAINIQDTAYAPSGDMFELGSKVQVVRKGLFFPARANKLYELYVQHKSLDEIDPEMRKQIQERYFRRTFSEVWEETGAHYERSNPAMLRAAEVNPKQKMALMFKWYFVHSSRLALQGRVEQKVDFQIHCGPALGAFNQWVKGSQLESWRNRRVADIAERLMNSVAELFDRRISALTSSR